MKDIYERIKEYPTLDSTFITQDTRGIYLYTLPKRYTVIDKHILPVCDSAELLAECIFDTSSQKTYQIHVYNTKYDKEFRELCEMLSNNLSSNID
jgi:hypothetical protein